MVYPQSLTPSLLCALLYELEERRKEACFVPTVWQQPSISLGIVSIRYVWQACSCVPLCGTYYTTPCCKVHCRHHHSSSPNSFSATTWQGTAHWGGAQVGRSRVRKSWASMCPPVPSPHLSSIGNYLLRNYRSLVLILTLLQLILREVSVWQPSLGVFHGEWVPKEKHLMRAPRSRWCPAAVNVTLSKFQMPFSSWKIQLIGAMVIFRMEEKKAQIILKEFSVRESKELKKKVSKRTQSIPGDLLAVRVRKTSNKINGIAYNDTTKHTSNRISSYSIQTISISDKENHYILKRTNISRKCKDAKHICTKCWGSHFIKRTNKHKRLDRYWCCSVNCIDRSFILILDKSPKPKSPQKHQK